MPVCELQFDEYLARGSADPNYTLGQHLRAVGGAIEEWLSEVSGYPD